MRLTLTLALVFACVPVLSPAAFAQSHHDQIPAARCGRITCGVPIDVSCSNQGDRLTTVVVPWSRKDLPSSVMAGTLTRLTFSTGPYRSSLYGWPRLRTRHGKTEAVFDLDNGTNGTLFSLLRTSRDVRVSGDYGSYLVVPPKKNSACL